MMLMLLLIMDGARKGKIGITITSMTISCGWTTSDGPFGELIIVSILSIHWSC